MPAGAAIVGSAVLGAGASIYGASRASSAAKDASKQASNAELAMYNQGRADLAPYRVAGYGALDQIMALYGMPGGAAPSSAATPTAAASAPTASSGRGLFANVGSTVRGMLPTAQPGTAGTAGTTPGLTRDAVMANFMTSPQYEWNRSEALRGLEQSAAARGGAFSGTAIRGSQNLASNLASGEFNSYVDRLFNIAGLGNASSTNSAQMAQNAGGNLAQIYQNQGNARASSYLAGAGGVNNAIQGGLQNWAFMNYLNPAGGGAGGAGSSGGGYSGYGGGRG